MSGTDQFVRILWRRRWAFVLTSLLVLAGAAAVTYALPKVYSTPAFLLVSSSRAATNDYEATQANQVLTKTYAELLQTRNVADAVAPALPYRTTGAAVEAAVEIAPVSGTQLIRIDAEGSTGARAQTLANTYARVFAGQSARLGGPSLRNGRVALAQPAPRPAEPSRPQPKLYLVVGAFLGALAGVAVALLRERFDQRLRIAPSTTEVFGLPILARVPKQRGVATVLTAHDGSYSRSHVSEAIRLLLANLTFANLGSRPSSLAVVSSTPSEGKSTVSLSIARAALEAGVEAVVVDADLRRPSLAATLSPDDAAGHAGLSSVLVNPEGQAGRDLALSSLGVFPNVILSGPLPPNPTSLLGAGGLDVLNERLVKRFELVIYDTPPVSVGADASLVAAVCEGIVIVVDVSKTRRDALLRAVDQLRRAESNILGLVLNRVSDAMVEYGDYGVRETRPASSSARVRGRRNGGEGSEELASPSRAR